MGLRYGLAGGLTYNSDEVARIMNMSRSRARSLEYISLAKLRNHPKLMSILSSAYNELVVTVDNDNSE